MTRLRHRRLRTRIALVAILALMWSQFALAGHAGCLVDTPAAQAQAVAMDDGCGEEMPSPEQPVCAAHCSDGGIAAENGRIPPVPPLMAVPAIPQVPIVVIAHGIDGGFPARVDSSPPRSWHRPTTHPAALLLI